MLAQIVGQVDWNSAAVLCVGLIVIGVIMTTAIAQRKSRRELQMQFEIDKQRLKNQDAESTRNCNRQHEFELAKLATDRDVQFHRIDTGLIEGQKN